MPRLPLASRETLLEELALIAEERRAMDGRIVHQERRDNKLASLADWERDIREQLAEMDAVPPVTDTAPPQENL